MLVLIVVYFFVVAILGNLYLRYSYWGRTLAKIPGKKTVPLIGNMLDTFFLTPGKKWKQRRKLLTPAFHFNILKRFCTTFNEQTEIFLERVEGEAAKERSDVIPLVTQATLNIMCETSMGVSGTNNGSNNGNTIMKNYFKALHDLGVVLHERFFKIPFHLDSIYKYSYLARQENKIVSVLHGFTKMIIEERKKHRHKVSFDQDINGVEVYAGKERLAMLDLLLENERDGKIDINGVREEVDTFLFEGHDTTAAALSFMIMRIANEPEVQERIFQEMVEIFGNDRRVPTTADYNEMKYLEMCIKESLRLYPSVPFFARYATEDLELGGYTVPAETILHIHVFDVHRNPELYPDPERFIPERFLPEPSAARHPYSYIPFSAGPRNCIGQKFAMLEMKTVMSTLLRRFHIDPVTKPEDVVFLADIVLRCRDPLYVRFRARTMV